MNTPIKTEYLCDLVIPCYKEIGYAERTISALMQQNLYKQGRIHIVIGEYIDPTNPTDDELKKFCNKYQHIDYVHIDKKGIAYARNMAIRVACFAPIIMNFDADCIFSRNDAVDKLLRPILTGEAILTNCKTILYDFAAQKPIEVLDNGFYYSISRAASVCEKFLPIARGPGLTFTRKVYDKVGGFPDVLAGEDYLITFNISMQETVFQKRFIDDVLVFTSDRRAKAYNSMGANAVDYNIAFR